MNFKSFRRGGSLLVLVVGVVAGGTIILPCPATAACAFRAELVDELEDLFPDSEVSHPPRTRFHTDAARGTIAGLHILVNHVKRGEPLRFTLRSHGEVVDRARWYRLVDVPVEFNTGLESRTEQYDGRRNPFVIRRAPFRVYDAIAPVESPWRRDAATAAIRVELDIPPDAEAGEHDYTIEVKAGGRSLSLSWTIKVFEVAVPPSGRDTLAFTNWFSVGNMAKWHGLEPWSEAHWEMIRRYARLMARSRQNVFRVNWYEFFNRVKDGTYVLNDVKLRRYVKLFLEEGFYYIEGGTVAHRPNADWSSTYWVLNRTNTRATSLEGNAELAHLARQVMREIDAHGWKDRWLQHVADEPTKENAADYRILAGMVRKYMPGIPILEATMALDLAGAVDIWCPQVQEYQKNRKAFDAFRKQGDRIWVYTCLVPGGPWLNRLLDQERMRPMLIGWAAARYDLDGYLHWGLNQYRANPFQQSVVRHPHVPTPQYSLPAGDTHVVYPGAEGPWSSMRLEAHRVGLEDYELLRLLKKRDPKRADAIIHRVIRAFDDYTKDPAVYRAAKGELLTALAADR